MVGANESTELGSYSGPKDNMIVCHTYQLLLRGLILANQLIQLEGKIRRDADLI